MQNHVEATQTRVIVNRVDRAHQLFRRLRKQRLDKSDLLIHARFRAAERAEKTRRLYEETPEDRIIVAAQAIEAGVDLSSKTLVTELAPWPSMVQRFGRCNRDGKRNADGASILWVDIDDEADALPYTAEILGRARDKLAACTSASPQDLRTTDETRPLTAVLRRKDLLDLFNADPDLRSRAVRLPVWMKNLRQSRSMLITGHDEQPDGIGTFSAKYKRSQPWQRH